MKRKVLIYIVLFIFCVSTPIYAARSLQDERPIAYDPGHSLGYFIWHDREGLHLRVSTVSGSQHTFSGSIHTDGMLEEVFTKMASADDYCRVNGNRARATFQFTSAGEAGGIDFWVTDGTYLNFKLSLDGNDVDPAEIFIGGDGWHPDSNQFTIYHEEDEEKHRGDHTFIIIGGDFWRHSRPGEPWGLYPDSERHRHP